MDFRRLPQPAAGLAAATRRVMFAAGNMYVHHVHRKRERGQKLADGFSLQGDELVVTVEPCTFGAGVTVNAATVFPIVKTRVRASLEVYPISHQRPRIRQELDEPSFHEHCLLRRQIIPLLAVYTFKVDLTDAAIRGPI